MLYSAMRAIPAYRSHLSPLPSGSYLLQSDKLPAIPTIRQFEELMEKAWSEGYDPAGAQHFRSRLVGTHRWIGTTELYTAFTYLGVRVKILDFPAATGPKGQHLALIRFVRDYFKQNTPFQEEGNGKKRQRDAFESLMATEGSTVVQTDKQPLFLQHQGHSRVIIGIEEATKGSEAALLIFDPSL